MPQQFLSWLFLPQFVILPGFTKSRLACLPDYMLSSPLSQMKASVQGSVLGNIKYRDVKGAKVPPPASPGQHPVQLVRSTRCLDRAEDWAVALPPLTSPPTLLMLQGASHCPVPSRTKCVGYVVIFIKYISRKEQRLPIGPPQYSNSLCKSL